MKITPALKKETIRIGTGCGIAVVLMWLVFFVLHLCIPEKVPFDYTVVLGGLGGFAVTTGNFFLMGLTVQKVTSETDEARARQRMQVSQKQRFMLMLLWGILALVVPGIHAAAGLIPLLFPSFVIKVYYLTAGKKQLYDRNDEDSAEKGSEE